MDPESLMHEGMLDVFPPTPVISGAIGAVAGGVGSVPVTFLCRCIQWKGNWEDSNREKIAQVKKQVGVRTINGKCIVVYGIPHCLINIPHCLIKCVCCVAVNHG